MRAPTPDVRWRVAALITATAISLVACGQERKSPTHPSALAPNGFSRSTALSNGPVVTPSNVPPISEPPSVNGIGSSSPNVAFPPRNEPYDFRLQLESKYRDGLRRAAASTYVDIEGDIVWTQEYLRYRVNRCTHSEAVQRVMFQIDGGAPLPACGDEPSGQVQFPPRNEPFDFRLQLESKYRDSLKRPASSSYVDIEGDIVWTQEYIRYRVNYCDHYEATQRVFMQIDGRGVQPVCASPTPVPPPTPPPTGGCAYPYCYYVSPEERVISSGGGVFALAVSTNRPDAQWTASSDQPWLAVVTRSGTGDRTVTYEVASNPFSYDRVARLTVGGLSGNYPPAIHTVTQRGSGSTASCTYTLLTPKSVAFGSTGGSDEVRFRLDSGTGCTWTARGDSSWISVADTGGMGEIRVRFSVASNSGAARSGRVEVRWSGPQQGENIGVTQAAR